MIKKAATLMLATLWLAACGNTADVPPADTGGSRQGDFGPPQGEPIKAVLTSPPAVPPPTNRKTPAKVIVELEVMRSKGSRSVTYTSDLRRHRARDFIRVRRAPVEFHPRSSDSRCRTTSTCTA